MLLQQLKVIKVAPLLLGILIYFSLLFAMNQIYQYAMSPPVDVITISEMSFQEVYNTENSDIVIADLQPELWQQVSLPDDWKLKERSSNTGIYRTNLSLNVSPNRLWAIYLPNINMNAAVFLNGSLLGKGGQFKEPLSRNLNTPLYYTIPNGLLRRGDNLIEVKLKSGLAMEGLIDRIYLGPEELLKGAYKKRFFIRITLLIGITVSLLLLTFLLGGLWLSRRQDTVYGWVSLISAMWSVHNLNLLIVDIPISTSVWNWLAHSTLGWFVIAMIIASHRIINISPPLVERALLVGGFVLSTVLAVLIATTSFYPILKQLWNSLFTLLGIYPLIRVYLAYQKHDNPELPFIVAAGLVVMSFGSHDWLIEMGLWDRTGGYLIQYSSPLLMLIFISILLSRFVKSLNIKDKLNIELEQRVAMKTEELQLNYEKLQGLEQDKILSEERARIMRDMHDGVGGHLVSALALMKDKDFSKQKVEESLKDGLTDLRIMIDSLDPIDNDLTTVLGMWRSRIQPVLNANQIQCQWKVEQLPEIKGFGPQKILHVLRILQETLTNILKHADATKITVKTGQLHTEAGITVFVEISDNGVGIPENSTAGRGLLNMKNRAKQISADLEINSNDSGTVMRLMLNRTVVD